MERLATAVLAHVLSYLPMEERFRFSRLGRRFRRTAYEPGAASECHISHRNCTAVERHLSAFQRSTLLRIAGPGVSRVLGSSLCWCGVRRLEVCDPFSYAELLERPPALPALSELRIVCVAPSFVEAALELLGTIAAAPARPRTQLYIDVTIAARRPRSSPRPPRALIEYIARLRSEGTLAVFEIRLSSSSSSSSCPFHAASHESPSSVWDLLPGGITNLATHITLEFECNQQEEVGADRRAHATAASAYLLSGLQRVDSFTIKGCRPAVLAPFVGPPELTRRVCNRVISSTVGPGRVCLTNGHPTRTSP